MTKSNIDAVQSLVAEDPNISVAMLSQTLDISEGSIFTILHEQLGLRKITARWVPHQLTEEQRRERVRCSQEFLRCFGSGGTKRLSDIVTGDKKWFHYFQVPNKSQNKVWIGADEERPTVLRSGFRSRKQMFVVFFSICGPVAVVMVPKGQNVNASYYTSTALPAVVDFVRQNQRTRLESGRIHLHHDNPSSHTAAMTSAFLEENRLKTVRHPPYSPDSAPCDFWAFPKLTEKLAGRQFQRPQDLARAINSELRAFTESEYRGAFDSWLRRHQK